METQKAAAAAEGGGSDGAVKEPTLPKHKQLLSKLTAIFQENSIPAVRKFARSPDAPHRLFWAAVFLGTFSGFVIHLVSITVRFRQIPVSTETRVNKVDRMPSIMICPLNYLNDVRMRRMKKRPQSQMNNMKFDELYNDILPMFWNLVYQLRGDTVDRRMVGLKIKNNFQWYLSSVWREAIEHEKQDVFLYTYMQDRQFDVSNISVSFDSSRNRCFAWDSAINDTQSLVTILNVPDGRFFYAEQEAFELVSDSGLLLHICFNGGFGCHDAITYFLRTGHFTKIDLRKYVVSQFAFGNTQCQENGTVLHIKKDIFNRSSRSVPVQYTSALCSDTQLQREIYNTCRCLSVLLPTETSLYELAHAEASDPRRVFCNLPPDFVFTHSGFPSACFSGDPYDGSSCFVNFTVPGGGSSQRVTIDELLKMPSTKRFIEADQCHDTIFRQRYSRSNCSKLCERQTFSSTHSIIPWPQSQLSREYPQTFARIFVNTITPYLRKALRRLRNSSLDASVLEAVNQTFSELVYTDFNKSTSYNKGMRYMLQRLLLLEIGYASTDMQTMSEGEAYPLKSFLSDIGGIMGLWIGMAIVSICELLLIVGRVGVFVGSRCLRLLTAG